MSGRVRRLMSKGVAGIALLPLIVWAIIVVYPLFWMVVTSFKTEREISLSFATLPAVPQVQNWQEAWQGYYGIPLYRHVGNSVITALPALVGVIAFCSLCGYSMTKLRLPGSRFLQGLLLVAISVPIHSVIVPLYTLMRKFHLVDTYVGLSLAYVAYHLPFAVTLIASYYRSFPDEILDAARTDGCSEWQAFWRVSFPMSKGALSSVAIISFLAIWNELLLSLILVSEPTMRTVQPAVASYRGEYMPHWGVVLAALTIVTIPPLVVYLIFQREITKGMTVGALR